MLYENFFYTILIAIIVTLLSNYISPIISNFLSKIFTGYRTRRDKKKMLRQRLIEEIASDSTLLTLASMKGYFFDSAFFLMVITYLVIPPKSLLYMFLALLFGLLSLVAAYRGGKQRKIVNDATAIYRDSLKTNYHEQ